MHSAIIYASCALTALVLLVSASPVAGQFEDICTPRNPTRIVYEIQPEDPDLGDYVNLSAWVEVDEGSEYGLLEGSPVPTGKMTLDFAEPYAKYSKACSSYPCTRLFQLQKERAHIQIHYHGTSTGQCAQQFQEARAGLGIHTYYFGAIGWIFDHTVALAAIFFVLIFYHWFTPGRLDIDKILAETGIMGILQDLFGSRKRQ